MSKYQLKTLPNQIINISQIYQIIGYIDESLSSKQKIETSKKVGIKGYIDQIELPEMMQCFFSDKISWYDLSDLRDQLDELVKTAPIATITLSGIPNTDLKMKLTSWFRALNPYILLEIIVDQSIIGGCIVKTERRELDLSMRSSFSSFSGNLLEMTHNV